MVRGGFHPTPEDNVPGNPASLVLIGNAGPNLWQKFDPASSEGSDPLDAWTRRVVEKLGTALGAEMLFPFAGPPYLPFQRWAQKCEPVHPSPIGPLIHPTYGLWHAYRAALTFEVELDLPPRHDQTSPCAACPDQPCLTTCPVGAFTRNDHGGAYNVPACVEFITSPAGIDCLEQGCAARWACPIGQEWIYDAPQAAFHMKAFAGSQKP